VAASEVFGTLANECVQTSTRIGQLQQRIEGLRSQVPQIEQLCGAGTDLSQNQRVEYKSNRTEKSQLFNPKTAMQPILKRHLANPPAPDLAPLDKFRSDGKPCIMFYTYPQFFLEEWAREQEKEMAGNCFFFFFFFFFLTVLFVRAKSPKCGATCGKSRYFWDYFPLCFVFHFFFFFFRSQTAAEKRSDGQCQTGDETRLRCGYRTVNYRRSE
jgi:hypothetical protein